MTHIIAMALAFVLLAWNGCGQVEFTTEKGSNGALDICRTNPAVCNTTPIVTTPGVVTVLLTLGDKASSALVIKNASSRIIAETAVKFASPKTAPKILVVRDHAHNGESAYDTQFIASDLLVSYDTDYMDEPASGLTAAHLAGYDLIWFNNPGYPMSNVKTRDALIAFAGGVILSGDDLSQGDGFSLEALTGLKFIDNGTQVKCGTQNFNHDNNDGYKFSLYLDGAKLPGYPVDDMQFQYGNDIDNTTAKAGVDVIARAVGGHSSCSDARPAIVRYGK